MESVCRNKTLHSRMVNVWRQARGTSELTQLVLIQKKTRVVTRLNVRERFGNVRPGTDCVYYCCLFVVSCDRTV